MQGVDPDFSRIAADFQRLGYEPFPLTGQREPMRKRWRATDNWGFSDWQRAQGIGIKCGEVIAIDVDTTNQEHVEAIRALLPEGTPAKVGSKGATFYLRSMEADAKKEVRKFVGDKQQKPGLDKYFEPKIEILAKGQYSAVPPSWHPNVERRDEWQDCEGLPPLDKLPQFDRAAFWKGAEEAVPLQPKNKGGRPRKDRGEAAELPRLEDLKPRLAQIPSDDYDTWFDITRILCRAYLPTPQGDLVKELWLEWCAKSPNHRPEVDEKQWAEDQAGAPADDGREIGWRRFNEHYRAHGGELPPLPLYWPHVNAEGYMRKGNIQNVAHALRFLGYEFRRDTFRQREEYRRHGGRWREFDDDGLSHVHAHLHKRGWEFSQQIILQGVNSMLADNKVNTSRMDFEALPAWDRVERLERWLIDYCGADDNPYTRQVGALVIRAMVRRSMQPGCKYDHMLILQGPQGCGKSTVCVILAGGEDWHKAGLQLGDDAKKVIEQTGGIRVAEIEELVGAWRGQDPIKGQITCQADRARLSYDRKVSTVPRQFIMIGTTNEERFLRDLTGARRYWPVRVGNIDTEALQRDRDQIVAEAMVWESARIKSEMDRAVYHALLGYVPPADNLCLDADAIATQARITEETRERRPVEIRASEALQDIAAQGGCVRITMVADAIGVKNPQSADYQAIRRAGEILGGEYLQKVGAKGEQRGAGLRFHGRGGPQWTAGLHGVLNAPAPSNP